MKNWFLHILLLAGLFGMLTTSCSQDEMIEESPLVKSESEKVTIRFTLDLGEQGGMSSRSTWEGYDEDNVGDSDAAEIGEGIENYINTDNLQVFMFSNEGTYIGGLKDMSVNETDDEHIYTIQGEVDVVKTAIVNETLNCKIMVVANANAATVTGNQVTGYNNNATFSHDVSYIPMWGIGTYSINLIQQLYVDLPEPIYMLRSMAKIEVTLAGGIYDDGYRITGATLNKYNTTGYVVPTLPVTTGDTPEVDWNSLTNTTSLSTTNVFRENESLAGTVSAPTTKSFSANVTGRSYVIYVPEYDNNNELSITLGLTHNGTSIYKDGTTPYTISLNEYKINQETGKSEPDPDSPLDLVRNHWYKYTINSIENGVEATLTVKVKDWDTDEESWNYKEQPSVQNDNDKMKWNEKESEDDNVNVVTIEGTNVYIPTATEDKPAICKFRISTPVGATWHATFETVGGDDYNAFMFLDADGNEVTSVSGKVGDPATLRIITTGTPQFEANKAILRIAVRTANRTMIVKELVPDNNNAEYTLVQSIQ